jgi:hypothetical protein
VARNRLTDPAERAKLRVDYYLSKARENILPRCVVAIMEAVFVLQHLHVLPNGKEDVKLIGVYGSLDSARAAVDGLRLQPGFRDYPSIVQPGVDDDIQGFHIARYLLDKDYWSEGYVTGMDQHRSEA